MTVDDLIEELKKNPHLDENLKAFEKWLKKVAKIKKGAVVEEEQ